MSISKPVKGSKSSFAVKINGRSIHVAMDSALKAGGTSGYGDRYLGLPPLIRPVQAVTSRLESCPSAKN